MRYTLSFLVVTLAVLPAGLGSQSPPAAQPTQFVYAGGLLDGVDPAAPPASSDQVSGR
jgi:hypothetical protein